MDGMLVQVMNDGIDDVGGDVFDNSLKNEIVARVGVERGFDDSVTVQPEAMSRLLYFCERAKMELSTKETAALFVRDVFQGVRDTSLDYVLSRDEMERIVAPLLDKGLSRIDRLLEAAGVSPSSVALCLATGGMVNMPAIKARLHELFGPQRVQVPVRSATLIAEGAAWVAHDEVKLQLAKNVELLLARNSYATLLKAGTEMPCEGEVRREPFHLYCADPRDGVAKFLLEVPVRPGPRILPNDRRLPLENLLVEVDSKAKPFHERLELDIEIDDNLVLHASARSLNARGRDEAEVHNLEFGLALPNSTPTTGEKDDLADTPEFEAESNKGAVVLRSNVTNRKDDKLVPGELLYTLNPGYFDPERKPPQIQHQEQMYYVPCSLCGRRANDPLCRCGSKLHASDRSHYQHRS